MLKSYFFLETEQILTNLDQQWNIYAFFSIEKHVLCNLCNNLLILKECKENVLVPGNNNILYCCENLGEIMFSSSSVGKNISYRSGTERQMMKKTI